MDDETKPDSDDGILRLARSRYDHCKTADDEDRAEAKEDLRFLKGGVDQWDQAVYNKRIEAGRPCLTVNKLPAILDQIVGDQRQNKPAITVRAVDSDSDPETAKILSGLIRNIENVSDAEVAYDHAFEMAAACGRGFFRITTEYCDDNSFDLQIKIKRVANPFTVVLGPHNEIDGSDAPYGFVIEKMAREEFKNNWPDKTARDFDDDDPDLSDWADEDQVVIAEYFYKKFTKGTLYLYQDGEISDKERKGQKPIKSRPLTTTEVLWCKTDGYQFLDKPKPWPGRYIPLIPVWGKEINIDGKRYTRGCIRHAKDPQRLYNYFRSTDAETVALQPRVPYLMTPAMIGTHQSMWKKAHEENLPYLLFNPDPSMPGAKPYREQPPVVSPGHVEQIQVASDDIKSTTGYFDASLGAKSNETSGKAIMARQREGDIGSFAYVDNLSRSMRHAGRILVDLVPKIYDTQRLIRIFNEDKTERFVQINEPFMNDKDELQLYDLKVGMYDVTVKTGPSYTTQRQEAAESMMNFIKVVPESAPLISDLVAKSMDWPGAEDIAKRLKKALPPGIAEPEEGEEEEMPQPQGPPPPPPDPILGVKLAIEEEKLKQQQSQTERAALEVELKKIELNKAEGLRRAEIEGAITGSGPQPTTGG